MVEREEQAVEEIPDEKRDDKDRRGNDPEVPSRLLAAQCFLRLFHIEEEVHVKVDAKKDHKHGNYALQVGGIASEAVILDTEPPVPAVPKTVHRESNTGICPTSRRTNSITVRNR